MTTHSLRLAVAHTPITRDVNVNSGAIQAQMHEAASAGCRLIQFPEGSLSGYCKQQITDWQQVDWVAIQTELTSIAQLAREGNIYRERYVSDARSDDVHRF